MKYEAKPCQQAINKVVSVPGSKSITNRALLLSALAQGTTVLRNALICDDTNRMVDCLRQLGVTINVNVEEETQTVVGLGQPFNIASANLFVGNSGTTARFITPAIAAGKGVVTLDGVARMRERPMQDLMDAVSQLGGNVASVNGTGCPPLEIRADGLRGGHTKVRANISSQFLSGLLLASPYAEKESIIEIDGALLSAPYVRMTIMMMADFGVAVSADAPFRTFTISAGKTYVSPGEYTIEPDASSASYFFAAAAVTGGCVTVRDIHRDGLQGDTAFTDVLEAMGCDVSDTPLGLCVDARGRHLTGVDLDMNAISDTLMTAAAVAPYCNSKSRFHNVGHVRHKETDRLRATANELQRFGVTTLEEDEALTVFPLNDQPVGVDNLWRTYDDHRMAMAAAVFALRQDGVVIEDPSCVNKTFPDFFDRWERLLA
jgi:3-phosphoshikimate 1-carboxyvinyltransferase